jgi:purine nucleoside phosphorylase
MLQRIQRIAEHLKKATGGFVPETGIILGTGLSGLGKEIEVKHAIPTRTFPSSR